MFLGKYRRIMILASALPIMQQLSGINTVVFYSSDVRHSACYSLSRSSSIAPSFVALKGSNHLRSQGKAQGAAGLCLRVINACCRWCESNLGLMQVFAKAGLDSPVLGSIIVGAVNVVGTTVAVFLMDHAGRRQLLLVSHAIMATCLAALSISSWLPCKSSTSLAAGIPSLFQA